MSMKPKIFIGSSAEAMDFTNSLMSELRPFGQCLTWDMTFPLSSSTLESLIQSANKNDFAVFMFTADDLANIRKSNFQIVRDNVLFEAGLFMGSNGRDHVFLVAPAGVEDFHTASDLSGFTMAMYDQASARSDLKSEMRQVALKIDENIRNSKWKNNRVDISARATFDAKATWPLKLWIDVVNNQSSDVTLESISFEFNSPAARAKNAESEGGKYMPRFEFATSLNANVRKRSCFLRPGESVKAWIGVHPDVTLPVLNGLVAEGKTGRWDYRGVWLEEYPAVRSHQHQL